MFGWCFPSPIFDLKSFKRNIDRVLSFVFPLLADSNANMKVQVIVLRKDTADIIGVKSKELICNNQSVKNTSNDVHHF